MRNIFKNLIKNTKDIISIYKKFRKDMLSNKEKNF